MTPLSSGWQIGSSLRRIGGAFLGLSIFFVPLALMRTFQEFEILEQANLYRSATFTVAEGQCTGGERNTTRSGAASGVERTRCTLYGSVEGTAEELMVSLDAVAEQPAGSAIPVWYAPELDAFGVDGQNLRLQWDRGSSPATAARKALWVWPIAFALLLFWLAVVELLYLFAGRWFWSQEGLEQLIVAGKSAAPALGFAFTALGMMILVGGLRRGDWGNVVIGAVPALIGLPFCFRPVAIVDTRAGVLLRRRAFGPLRIPTGAFPLSEVRQILLAGPTRDESLPSINARVGRKKQVLVRDQDVDALRSAAHALARQLGVELDDRLPRRNEPVEYDPASDPEMAELAAEFEESSGA